MFPRYILLDNGTKFKNHQIDQVLQQPDIDCIFSTPYHPQSNGKLGVFHRNLKPTFQKLCKKDLGNWDKYSNQVLISHRVTPDLTTVDTPFLSIVEIQAYQCTNFWNPCNDS